MLNKKQIKLAIKKLQNNEVIILPTNTIYGLSAIQSKDNEIKINRIKEALDSKPLIVLISSISGFSSEIKKLLKDKTPTTVIIKEDGIKTGYRYIKRKDLKKIIETVGPIFSTSVNKTSQTPLIEKDDLKKFSNEIMVFFDKKIEKNIQSRIYDFDTGEWIR